MQTDQLNLDGRRIEYRFVEPDRRRAGVDLVMLHEGLGLGLAVAGFPGAAGAGDRLPHAGLFPARLRPLFAARCAAPGGLYA